MLWYGVNWNWNSAQLTLSSLVINSNVRHRCHCFPCLLLGTTCSHQTQQGTFLFFLFYILTNSSEFATLEIIMTPLLPDMFSSWNRHCSQSCFFIVSNIVGVPLILQLFSICHPVYIIVGSEFQYGSRLLLSRSWYCSTNKSTIEPCQDVIIWLLHCFPVLVVITLFSSPYSTSGPKWKAHSTIQKATL